MSSLGPVAETSSRHPCLEDLSKHRGAPPTAVVIFGASGDLTARKLIPAFYHLYEGGYLPENFALLGVSRTELSDDDFRKQVVYESTYLPDDLPQEKKDIFAKMLFY